jgi:hypothetical protein
VSDIIDLSIRRAQREAAADPGEQPQTRFFARRGRVYVQIVDAEGTVSPSPESAWTLPPAAAHEWAMSLLEASHAADAQLKSPCEGCGVHGCREVHPGQRWSRWRIGGVRQTAIVEARCKKSWRFRDLATGQKLWVKNPGWEWTFEGWGPELNSVETKETP